MAQRQVLAPGQPMPTHPRSQATSSSGFLTKELDWKRIWAARWWVLSVLVVFYAAGLSVNHGRSMSNLGWVYLHGWFSQPTHDGDIFVFVPANKPAWMKYVPGQQWVKRRVGITAEGSYVFKGDNEDWSTDNRDGLKPVPPDHVAGVVVSAWTPQRVLSTFTPSGRLKNKLTLTYYPTWTKFGDRTAAAWSPQTNVVSVFIDGKLARTFHGWSLKSNWRDGAILLGCKKGELWSYLSYTPVSDMVISNLDSEGNRSLSDKVHGIFHGMSASGGIVYALDNNPATNWIVGSTKPKDNVSELNFPKLFTGKVKFCGTIVSGVVLRVSTNGGPYSEAMPPWKAETISLVNAHEVRLKVSKIDAAESLNWKISSVEFTP